MNSPAGLSADGSTIGAIGEGNTVNYNTYAAVVEVSWPVRVGLPPAVADRYQDRGIDIEAQFRTAHGASRTVISAGMGGNGKTQLAAAYARHRWNQGELDLLVWITAASRVSVITGYALAARDVRLDLEGRDSEQAAAALLPWLESTTKRWLVVLDDLADPRDLDLLWPTGKAGRVLVTTRRTDGVLREQGRVSLDVSVFTVEQASSYLRRKVAVGQADDVEGLAQDLGRLPLALAQAASYITDHPRLTCRSYRERLADRRRTLDALLPAPAPADEYPSTTAAAWSLSLEAADALEPRGVAGRVLAIAAWLDPNGIPVAVFATSAAASYLSGGDRGDHIGPDDVDDALSNLTRFSLINLGESAGPGSDVIRVHALIQRTARDRLDEDERRAAMVVSADALVQAWPPDDHRVELSDLTAAFRANTAVLRDHADALLWSPAHAVLFRAGQSLTGRPHEAVTYWEALAVQALRRSGMDDPDTLTSRNYLARAYRDAGRVDEAILLFEATLAARTRILGPEHPDTLHSRNNLARGYRDAGRVDEAIPLIETSLAARERILGREHPATLSCRGHLASAYRDAGRLDESIPLIETSLAARERILGREHPDTLHSRNNLARAYREAGRVDESIPIVEATLAARTRILGPEHPDTLHSRNNLAGSYQAAGRLDEAIALFGATLAAREWFLGPQHPDTQISRTNLAAAQRAEKA